PLRNALNPSPRPTPGAFFFGPHPGSGVFACRAHRGESPSSRALITRRGGSCAGMGDLARSGTVALFFVSGILGSSIQAGVDAMREKYRSLLLCSGLPGFLLAGMFTAAQAQESPSVSRWSDPATWPNRKVPAAGE